MTNQQVIVLVVVFALVWALNMGLGGWQARRFMRAVREVRMAGRTAIGQGGGRLGGRAYVALAVDSADRVVAATSLAGRTILAAPTRQPSLVGHHLTDLLEPASGPLGDTTLGAATADAARHLQDATAPTTDVDDESTDEAGATASGSEGGHLPSHQPDA